MDTILASDKTDCVLAIISGRKCQQVYVVDWRHTANYELFHIIADTFSKLFVVLLVMIPSKTHCTFNVNAFYSHYKN